MDRLEKASACFLHSINGLGNRSLWNIQKQFGSFTSFITADSRELYSSALNEGIISEILERRKTMDPLICLDDLERRGIQTVCIEEHDYPQLLRNIHNPPFILYYAGTIQLSMQFCLALVGSRRASIYGKKVAHRFSQGLAGKGVVVVSGMARGIDTEAHLGALEAGGYTVAVLGSGLDQIYPRENVKLYERIISHGLVLSEFPLHTRPEPGNFPMRNRLISGLSRGVVVVEAKSKSGALITADFALEQGRDVFAVPGPVDSSTSEGTNNLIKQGAKLISGIEDILEEYACFRDTVPVELQQEQLLFFDENENKIIQHLGNASLHFDELLNGLGIDVGLLSTLLLKMELSGIVKSLPGNYYVKI
ncbi:MAG: DNA-processing protein DprA [Syntrophomonadaceae bacterium]|nr:DNA-processing protein DprA [Syntrophomonadaceae bacterium]